MNKLFHVQDADRPMFVIAGDWNGALAAWRRLISTENEEPIEDIEPDGIVLVCGPDELLIGNGSQ